MSKKDKKTDTEEPPLRHWTLGHGPGENRNLYNTLRAMPVWALFLSSATLLTAAIFSFTFFYFLLYRDLDFSTGGGILIFVATAIIWGLCFLFSVGVFIYALVRRTREE